MTRRIRWQILIATISSLLVLGLMGYLALSTIAVSRPLAGGDYIEGLAAPPQQLNPLSSRTYALAPRLRSRRRTSQFSTRTPPT